MTEFYEDQIPKLKQACAFIAECNTEQRGCLLNEILMFSDIIAWVPEHKTCYDVKSVSINGPAIQLNCED